MWRGGTGSVALGPYGQKTPRARSKSDRFDSLGEGWERGLGNGFRRGAIGIEGEIGCRGRNRGVVDGGDFAEHFAGQIDDKTLGQGEWVAAREEDGPIAFEAASAQWQFDEMSFTDGLGGDPAGEDAGAEIEADHFDGGEIILDLEEGLEIETFLFEVVSDAGGGGGAFGGQDEAGAAEFGAIDFATHDPGMERMGEEPEFVGAERDGVETGGGGGLGQPEQAGWGEELGGVGGLERTWVKGSGGVGEGEREVGEAVADFSERRGEHASADGGSGEEAEAGWLGCGPALDTEAGGVHLSENGPCFEEEDFAGGREGEPAWFTDEQLAAEVVFEGFEGVTDAGGGEPEGGGGQAHVESLREGDEDEQLTTVEHGFEGAAPCRSRFDYDRQRGEGKRGRLKVSQRTVEKDSTVSGGVGGGAWHGACNGSRRAVCPAQKFIDRGKRVAAAAHRIRTDARVSASGGGTGAGLVRSTRPGGAVGAAGGGGDVAGPTGKR